MSATKTDDTPPVLVKKYANRRLYNTDTSTYITLDELYQMVKDDVDFVVQDAKTGEDLTQQVLTQIIFEQESRGFNILPASFLRSIIQFYGEDMQKVLPHYLEAMMKNFTTNQQQWAEMVSKSMGMQPGYSPFTQLEELSKQNMALFEQAMSMFNPFEQSKKNKK
jgi:polyhydroxyalkanoate synthesis repressor PhaR